MSGIETRYFVHNHHPMIEFTLAAGDPIALKTASARKFKGTRLPGSDIIRADRDGYAIVLQLLELSSFSLCYRQLEFTKDQYLNTRERFKGWRLEAVLTGELTIKEADGKELTLLANQYRITDSPIFQSHFSANRGCSYFSVYFGRKHAEDIADTAAFMPTGPRNMPARMREKIFELLENPYEGKTRAYYYENAIRDLALHHINAPIMNIPGKLTEKERAAVYAADAIIAQNIERHIKIADLARMVHSNTEVLKRGFLEVFGMGVFGRLLERRMERAKLLLEETDKPIQLVSELAGYSTVAGFITSFRRQFEMTPKDWRKKRRSGL